MGSARRCRGLIVLVALWLLAIPLLAQGASVQSEISESVDVRLVNVDVVVKDRKGRGVSGLTRSDFRVFEDGREVEISNFFSYAQGTGGAVQSQRFPPRAEVATNVADAEPLTLLIYLDERNLPPNHRERVLGDLETFLEEEAFQGTDFVVASYGNRLQILTGPTRELRDVASALEQAPGGSSVSVQDAIAQRLTLSSVRDAYTACENVGRSGGSGQGAGGIGAGTCDPCTDAWPDMVNYARRYSEIEQSRTSDGISAMSEVVQAMAGLAGRKALLYVGDGYQQRAGYAIFSYLGDLCGLERPQAQQEIFRAVLDYDSSRRFDQFAAFANANRTTVYMLDAGGVRAGQSVGVDFTSKKFAPTTENDRLRVDNIQASHSFIARETGGQAILNANRPLKALQDLAKDLGTGSYSLGFVPSHGPTGLIHRLRVELTEDLGQRIQVLYRRSYHDKLLEERLVDRLNSSLYLDTGVNQLSVQASLLESHPDVEATDGGAVVVPVEILIPEDSVLLVPEGGPNSDESGQVRVWLSAVSDRGEFAGMRQRFFDLGSGRQQSEEGYYRILVNMSLPSGQQTIAVGVRDEVSGSESLLRLTAGV